jgi:tetratricopeptide (TPR) repeat protein
MKSRPLLFWGPVAVAFLVRTAHVLVMMDPARNPLLLHPIMDAAVHDQWARALLAGTWPGSTPFFRAPLYVYLLALLYQVFGPENRLAIQLVHVVVSAVGGGLAALCADRIWGRRAGWLAGIMYSLLWTSIYFAGELLIVSLITTLDLLLLWLLLRRDGANGEGAPTRITLFLAGLVWGLSAIARPNILILAPLLIWYLARRRRLRRVSGWLVLAAGLALPILPVAAHNVLGGGDLVLIASQGGVNFYIGNNPLSDGQTAYVPGTRPTWQGGFEDVNAQAEKAAGHPLRPSQIDRYYLGRGLRFWAEQPGTALRIYAHKLRLLLAAGERANNKNLYFWRDRSPVLRWPLWLGWAPVLLLSVLGFWRRDLASSRRLLLLGSVLLYALSIWLFFVNARYRLPVLAMLTIAAGGGLDRVIAAARSRSWPDARTGLFVAGAIFAFSVLPDQFSFHGDEIQADPFSWHTMGNSYLAAGRLQEAAEAYEKAIEINRRYPQPRFAWIVDSLYEGLGDVRLRQGRTEEAGRVWREWVRVRPENPDARVRLGDHLMKQGRFDEAAAHLEIAMRQDPDHYGARLGYAWILLHNGEAGAALRRFQALDREHPDVQALFGSALSLMQLGRLEEAEEAFQEVLHRDPDYWQALGNLAGIYEQTDRQEEAADAYRRLLALQPHDTHARRWLAAHDRGPARKPAASQGR